MGGYVTEYMSWRYIFYINIPFGFLALAGAAVFLPETQGRSRSAARLVWLSESVTGHRLTAAHARSRRPAGLVRVLGNHHRKLSRGAGLYMFNVHCLTAKQPFLDPRLLAQRNFFLGLVFAFIYGFIATPPMVLMPSFLDHVRGYPIDTIGLLQAPRGFGLFAAMMIGAALPGASIHACRSHSDCCAWRFQAGRCQTGRPTSAYGRWCGPISCRASAEASFSCRFRSSRFRHSNRTGARRPPRSTTSCAALGKHRCVGRAGLVGADQQRDAFAASRACHPFQSCLAGARPQGWSMATSSRWQNWNAKSACNPRSSGSRDDFHVFALIALAALPLLLLIRKTSEPRGAADRAEAMVIAE